MQTETAKPASYDNLFVKIESLSGLDKKKFCQSLTREEKKAYIDYLGDKDKEMVTGVFRCFEPVGGSVTFTAMAFTGEVPVKYQFNDGETYTIPRYLARRMENEFQGCGTWYPTNSHLLDANGQPVVSTGKKNRRFGFSGLEFQ